MDYSTMGWNGNHPEYTTGPVGIGGDGCQDHRFRYNRLQIEAKGRVDVEAGRHPGITFACFKTAKVAGDGSHPRRFIYTPFHDEKGDRIVQVPSYLH